MAGSTCLKWATFCQMCFFIYCNLKVNQNTLQISDGVAKSIHFHLFMFINVTAIIFILYVYPFCQFILSEISDVVSCCLPTGMLTAFMHTKFDSKYLISLQITSYQFRSMRSKLGGLCRSGEDDSPDDGLFCPHLTEILKIIPATFLNSMNLWPM